MKEWWLGLETRERRTLILGGIGLILTLWLSTYLDYRQEIQQMHKRIDEQRRAVAWMRAAEQEVRSLKPAGGANRAPTGSLISAVDQAAKSAGLGANIKRLQPEGDRVVKVWFEKAPFDEVATLLEQMQRLGLANVTQASIEQQGGPGLVDARLTLEAKAP